jgi:hypothetical protein
MNPMTTKLLVPKGTSFVWLRIVRELPPTKGYHRIFLCQCKCGRHIRAYLDNLRSGNTSSCGCYRSTKLKERNFKHGLSKIPEYLAWKTMKARCYNQNSHKFPDYGGRGIKVCRRWRESFITFYTDMGSRPSPKHSVERKGNNGPYSPSNCIWATGIAQGSNKRNNRLISFQGQVLTMSEWSRRTGIPVHTIRSRIKYNWDIERVLTTRPRKLKPRITKPYHQRDRNVQPIPRRPPHNGSQTS